LNRVMRRLRAESDLNWETLSTPILVDTTWLAAQVGCVAPLQLIACAPYKAPEAAIPDSSCVCVLSELRGGDGTTEEYCTPAAGSVAALLAAHGVDREAHVVLYSTEGLALATRAWWTIRRTTGHHRLSILNGGLLKWQGEGRPVVRGFMTPRPARYRPPGELPLPLCCTHEELLHAMGIAAQQLAVVSTLPAAEHRDGSLKYAPTKRRGRIKGSSNLPCSSLVCRSGTALHDVVELRSLLQHLLSRDVVAYCGNGIESTILAFALALLGRELHCQVLEGGLSKWSSCSQCPLEKGGPILITRTGRPKL